MKILQLYILQNLSSTSFLRCFGAPFNDGKYGGLQQIEAR